MDKKHKLASIVIPAIVSLLAFGYVLDDGNSRPVKMFYWIGCVIAAGVAEYNLMKDWFNDDEE